MDSTNHQGPPHVIKGRGAQLNVHNPFFSREYVGENIDEYIEPLEKENKTELFDDFPKKIVNKVDSPDLGLGYSINPYQGCEHGCIYCYARNTHTYWGFSAGLDFERKIIVKRNAADLLRKAFDNPKWKPSPVMVSGNTDCYQPTERKLKLTRSLLEVFLEYRNPVGMITKNSLVLRDKDLLQELARLRLVHVNLSITSLNEDLRQKMEPRTATATQRLRTVEELSKAGIPVGVMVAPVIPSINDHEIPKIMQTVAEHGALGAWYTIVRLNGQIGEIFTDWVRKHFPDRAEKVLKQISSAHGGKLNDSRWGTRMRGEGIFAETVKNLHRVAFQKYFADKEFPKYDLTLFKRPEKGQLKLF